LIFPGFVQGEAANQVINMKDKKLPGHEVYRYTELPRIPRTWGSGVGGAENCLKLSISLFLIYFIQESYDA
jgi:hypothetical protein